MSIDAETRQRVATQGLTDVISDILRSGIGAGEIKQDADVALLTDWGLVERNEAGLLFVPYEEIEADFVLKASAA